jgi:hypothetical protein
VTDLDIPEIDVKTHENKYHIKVNKHLKIINVQMYIKPKLRTICSSIIHAPLLFVQSNIDEKFPIMHGTKRAVRTVLLIGTVVLRFGFACIFTLVFFKYLFMLMWYLF